MKVIYPKVVHTEINIHELSPGQTFRISGTIVRDNELYIRGHRRLEDDHEYIDYTRLSDGAVFMRCPPLTLVVPVKAHVVVEES